MLRKIYAKVLLFSGRINNIFDFQSSLFNGLKTGKVPRSFNERGLPFDRKQAYRRALLEALSGLILVLLPTAAELTWEARLQLPFFHFNSGSGHAVQYQPDEYSDPRLQPWHCSVI
jgi:hypothetical protein